MVTGKVSDELTCLDLVGGGNPHTEDLKELQMDPSVLGEEAD